MNYAILRVQKLNSAAAVAAAENHSFRRRNKIKTLLHPEMSKQNRVYTNQRYSGMTLNEVFKNRTQNASKKPRKNAVRYIETILSFSPGFIDATDMKQLQTWTLANIDFLKSYYGVENLTKVVLHLDESTPHLHAFSMCITPDGRLNANDYVGGRGKLSQLQTLYAEAMEQFGLCRGANYINNNLDFFDSLKAMDKPVHRHQKEFWAEQQEQKMSIADEVLRYG